jgi:hypothetical protein
MMMMMMPCPANDDEQKKGKSRTRQAQTLLLSCWSIFTVKTTVDREAQVSTFTTLTFIPANQTAVEPQEGQPEIHS